jgi:hypothetical protein
VASAEVRCDIWGHAESAETPLGLLITQRSQVQILPPLPGQRPLPIPGEAFLLSDAQHELGEVEGLGEVVVGAEPEATDPFPGGAGGGQHEDHDGPVGLGDHPAEHVTVDAGQVAVQDDDLVVNRV